MSLHIARTWAPLLDGYDVVLCDVWGVLHNGIAAWPAAYGALQRARQAGKTVVLITNAPRLHPRVRRQLSHLGVPEDAYDDIVTSGDVTRTLVAGGPRKVLHIGTERDLDLFEGLDVERVDEDRAEGVVVSGPFDDETETPDDYADLMARLKARDLPMVCANPDIVVERGQRLVYCAGAIAHVYAELGGKTLIAGKPHRPIYVEALRRARTARGTDIEQSRVLAIGDGLATDIKGAMDYGLDFIFVTDGIHAREYGAHGAPDPARLDAFLANVGARPVAAMVQLR